MSRTAARLMVALIVAIGAPAAADIDDQAMGRRVQALLHAHQAEVFACVSKQREAATGEALLRVFIGARGAAARVELLKVEAGQAATRVAADCVAAAARAWDLSSLRAAEGDQVVFPLAFRPERANESAAIGAQISSHVIKPGGRPWNAGSAGTRALYVVSGDPWLSMERAGQPVGGPRASSGDLFFVGPGVGVSVSAMTKAVVLEIRAVGGTSAAELTTAHRTEGSLPIYTLPDGLTTVRLFLDGVASPFAVDKMCATRGASVPLHDHVGSDELVYVLEGRATMTLGGSTVTHKEGDIITIPRRTSHSLQVDQDLCVVQVYAPAGPEQRFKRPPP